MPEIVDFSQVVQAALREFINLFSCEPQATAFG